MTYSIKLAGASFIVEENNTDFWEDVNAGKWERNTLKIIQTRLSPNSTFVDVGSWIGPTALFAANFSKRVSCIEADPTAASLLRRNVELNPKLSHKIEVIEKAISPKSGSVKLGVRTGRGDSMSSMLFADAADNWLVDSITPNQIAAMFSYDEKLLFKIDIEGGEYEVLKHFKPLADLPNAEFLIAFHPRFLPAKSLWSPSAAIKTAIALRPFSNYRITLIKKKSTRPVRVFSALNNVGMAVFPVHHSLFLSRHFEPRISF